MDEARKNLSKSAFENLQKWLSESKFLEFREEIFEMIDNRNWQELEDAFFKVLEFGTAGRRGKVGVGSNRINEITIGESVQALAEYLKSEFSEKIRRENLRRFFGRLQIYRPKNPREARIGRDFFGGI